jgi:hypothetical protein
MRRQPDHSRGQFRSWLHRQSFPVRWLVLTALAAALVGAWYGIMRAFGQHLPLSSAMGMAVAYPLFAAMVNKERPPEPNAWMRRRFPRVYRYFEGFQNKPDPRLSRFKTPEADE